MQALHSVMPELVPRPIGTGHYARDGEEDKWFFLSEFKEMIEGTPDVEVFASMIAEMHRRGQSPGHKFGFSVPTYGGRIPMIYPPSDTWEELFTQVMHTTFDVEEQTQGPDADMQYLREVIMSKVIPRLLRPMESNGHTVIPTLVHSDLWHGNVGIDARTDTPVIFDALALYAHNECEFHPAWK